MHSHPLTSYLSLAAVIALCTSAQLLARDPVVLARWPGAQRGEISATCVSGDFAYCAAGKSLLLLNVQSLSDIRLSGACGLTGTALDIALQDPLCFLATGKTGMQIVDVSLRDNPRLIGSYTNCDSVKAVEAFGNRAYIADGTNGLTILNIAIPAGPTFVGRLAQPGLFAEDVAISGTRTYVAAGRLGLLVVDTTSESNPVLMGSFETPGYACGVIARDTTVYVADGNAGVVIVDASNPGNIHEIARFPTPGYTKSVSLSNDYLLAGAGDAGTHLINVSNPSQPILVDSFNQHLDWVEGVTASDQQAYVAAGSRLDVLDFSSGLLSLTGAYVSGGRAVDVCGFTNGLLAVADAAAGWQLLQTSTNNELSVTLQSSEPSYSVTAFGNAMCFGEESSGTRIWNLDPPGPPILVSNWKTNGFANKTVPAFGTFACTAASGAGLQVVDLGAEGGPLCVGSYDTRGLAYSVVVDGTTAYVADGPGGLAIIDISNPYRPTRRALISTLGRVESVAIYKSYLLAAVWNVGIQIFSITNSANPLLATWNQVPNACGLTVRAETCFVTGGTNGTWILDLQNPSAPSLLGYCNPGGFSEKIFVSGNIGYLANGPDGITVLQVYGFEGDKPRILQHPRSQTFVNAAAVKLAVEAQGAEPLSYQWTFNGEPMVGETNAELHFSFASNRAGAYSVSISNRFGSTQSENARLELLREPFFTGVAVSKPNSDFLFQASLHAQPGMLYALEEADSLAGPWTFVRYCLSDAESMLVSESSQISSRFYRARLVGYAVQGGQTLPFPTTAAKERLNAAFRRDSTGT